MDALLEVVSKGNDFLWSFLLILLLCGTGVYYTVRLKFIQVRKFGEPVPVYRNSDCSPGGYR